MHLLLLLSLALAISFGILNDSFPILLRLFSRVPTCQLESPVHRWDVPDPTDIWFTFKYFYLQLVFRSWEPGCFEQVFELYQAARARSYDSYLLYLFGHAVDG